MAVSARTPLLGGYTIGGDLIDRITEQAGAAERAGSRAAADVTPASVPGTGADLLPPAREPPAADNTILFPGTELADSPPEYPLEHTTAGVFAIFTIGDLTWRLGGVKPLFVTSLRVNVKVSTGARHYYDGFDLYLSRSRISFAQAAGRALGVEPARVERDCVRILERLEAERDRQMARGGGRAQTVLSDAERQAGMALLADPALFTRIVDDLSSLGYVGEDLNKQLLYLCASSRKRDNPLSVLILSQSASGKSYLVDCVRRLIPEDEVIAVTSLSDQALNYLTDLEHKFLILGEAVHSEAVEHQIREMLSGKELSRLVVEKDPETGRMESRMMRMKVVVSSVMGSTAGKVNPENASRCFVIHADESRAQTELIHESQRRRHGLGYLSGGAAHANGIIQTHRAAQHLLRNIPVVNEFAVLLDFPAALMRSRRDHERFLDLIDAVCFLRQYQKQTESRDGVTFIRCDLTDYATAWNIMVHGVLSSTMEELPKGARLLYEQVREWVRGEAQKKKLPVNELRFTQRQIREATGLAHSWTAAMLRVLADWEYLEVAAGGGQRSKAWYTLRTDETIVSADLSMIPSPAELDSFLKTKTGKTVRNCPVDSLSP